MRTKVAVVTALDRVLDGLAEELLGASDEEIIAVARELGMDPSMRGSAAFLGLKYAVPTRPADVVAEIREWFKQRGVERIANEPLAPVPVSEDPVPKPSPEPPSPEPTTRKPASRKVARQKAQRTTSRKKK